jgi:two-component system response regulator AtoC
VVSIHLPALRERKEDLPELMEYFLHRYSQTFNKNVPALSKTTLKLLQNYHWPGNVRELENVIKKIVLLENEALALSELLQTDSKPTWNHPKQDPHVSPKISLKNVGKLAAREAERQLILQTLMETRWNRKKVAEQLDISYKALLYKIKQNNISRKNSLL